MVQINGRISLRMKFRVRGDRDQSCRSGGAKTCVRIHCRSRDGDCCRTRSMAGRKFRGRIHRSWTGVYRNLVMIMIVFESLYVEVCYGEYCVENMRKISLIFFYEIKLIVILELNYTIQWNKCHWVAQTKWRSLSQTNIPESICTCQYFEQTRQSLNLWLWYPFDW